MSKPAVHLAPDTLAHPGDALHELLGATDVPGPHTVKQREIR